MKYEQGNGFWKRVKGLSFSVDTQRVLYIPRCRCVHTFGMFFSLDLYWVKENMEVLRRDRNVRWGRVRSCKEAFGVIEVASDVEVPVDDRPCFLSDESGQALVEAALILPIILLIVFGFLQFSILSLNKQKMVHMNNYSVQIGSLTNDNTKIIGGLEEFGDLPMDQIQVEIESFDAQSGNTVSVSNRRYNDVIQVNLQWEYPLLIPFFSWENITLQTTSSSRVLCRNNIPPYVCE